MKDKGLKVSIRRLDGTEVGTFVIGGILRDHSTPADGDPAKQFPVSLAPIDVIQPERLEHPCRKTKKNWG